MKEGTLLNLSLSVKDRLDSYIFTRLLPVLILIALFLTYVRVDSTLAEWIFGIIVFLIISFLVIINATIRVEIAFRVDSIELTKFQVIGRRTAKIMLDEIDFIEDEIYYGSRISGSFYRLVLKNKKRILLLRISGFTGEDEQRVNNLNIKLEELTGIKVKSQWNKL